KYSNIEAMTQRGVDLNGPVAEKNSEASYRQRGISREFYPDRFTYNAATDTFRCPAGQELKPAGTSPRAGGTEHRHQALETACQCCRFRDQCCPKNSSRMIVRKENSPAVVAFQAKMQTEPARQLYRTRAQIAEFPHAWIKEKLQVRQFRLKGLLKVGAEALWV